MGLELALIATFAILVVALVTFAGFRLYVKKYHDDQPR